MKINELITEGQVDEGLGSMIGKGVGALAKGVGATVGGAVGAWDAAKKGYAAGKATVAGDPDPTAPAAETPPASGTAPTAPTAQGTAPAGGTTPPAQGGSAPTQGGTSAPTQSGSAPTQGGTQSATPSAGGSAPTQGKPAPSSGSTPANNAGDIGSILQAIDKLDKPSKQQLAGELEKNIAATPEPAPEKPAATPPAGGTAPAPGTTPPAAEEPGYDPQTGVANAAMAAQNRAAGKAKAPYGFNPQTGEPNPPPTGGTAPTGGTTPPATGTAPTTPPAGGGKLTQAQQDAMKARLQGQRAAGKTTATQTGSGFKDYVGGSQEKMAGVDASGAPVFKKLQRESVAFSKFLGVHI